MTLLYDMEDYVEHQIEQGHTNIVSLLNYRIFVRLKKLKPSQLDDPSQVQTDC